MAVDTQAEVALDDRVEVLAAEAVQCMALLLAEAELLLVCGRRQVVEPPVVCTRWASLARHRSVSRAVQVNFAHRRVQGIWDQLAISGRPAIMDRPAILDQQARFDRVVLKVLLGHERTRVLAIIPEM